MPLFEVSPDGLMPFRQLETGAGAYDEAIEDVLWRNLDSLVGERLFRVRRQAPLDGGGRPAVVALDPDGSVVVFHVRRQMDRAGLAECLEYAGWARAATLDELAMLYWRGDSEFWTDWHAFVGGGNRSVRPAPRLFLATGDFTARAQSTFEFLVDNGLPVKVMKAALYESSDGRRVLEVDGPSDVESVLKPSPAAEATFERLSRSARRSAERSADRAVDRAADRELPSAPVGVETTQIISPAPPARPHPLDPGAIPGRVIDPQSGRTHELQSSRTHEPVSGRAHELQSGRAHEPQSGRTHERPGRELERGSERPERPIERGHQRELERAPERPIERGLERPTERGLELPARRNPDPLQDPLSGGLLPPPTPLTAEQLRTDPLGMDQIVAGQLANEPDKPEQPTDRSALDRTGPQAVLPPIGDQQPFHRGGPPTNRGSQPTQPLQSGPPPGIGASGGMAPTGLGPMPPTGLGPAGAMPPPPGALPPAGFGHPPQQPDFESPLPDHPDMRSLPPRRSGFPPTGPSLSVVPSPDQGKEPDQRPEPPVGESPEPGDDRPERTRLSDIMDPRMLRVPDGFAWGDPRTANGKRENGHRENGHRDNNGR
jgi:hypothetical protein